MAAGWPTKVTYANGDVFNASDIDDTNGTLNYIDPTSATNNQVLTRDSTAPGKVKWANSPANTLTTTGDLYYASAANTPARLGIGATSSVLTVVGGVPAWSSGGGGMTVIASGTLSGASVDLTSIPNSYINLALYLMNPSITSAGNINLTLNNITTASSYVYQYTRQGATTITNSFGSNLPLAPFGGFSSSTTSYYASNTFINNYTSTTSKKEISSFMTTSGPEFEIIRGYNTNVGTTTSAISSVKLTPTSNFTGGTYVLYGVK